MAYGLERPIGKVLSFATQNETDAFPKIYDDHHKMVRSVLFKMCGVRELDDLVQEVFLRIWKGLKKFRHQSQLKTWIYRITVNTAFEHFRKSKNRKRELELMMDVPIRATQDHDLMYQDIVQKGLNKLSDKYRTVLVLTVMEGLPLSEVAQIIKIPEGTVKSRLHYARQEFLAFLNRNGVQL